MAILDLDAGARENENPVQTDQQPSRAYIGLGSNLENPRLQVEKAISALKNLEDTTFVNRSPWYQSVAIGPGEQADYINGVAAVDTYLSPESLLASLQSIENAQGRQREIRWGARTLDLDLLLYKDIFVSTDRLQLPHPRLQERNFVLYPLADIAPDLVFPDGTKLEELVSNTGMDGLKKLEI